MKILSGDCLKQMLKIPDSSVDLVFADLPYAQTNHEWDSVIPFEPLWKELKRVGKPNTAYIFTATRQFMVDVVLSNRDWYRENLIWNKGKGSNFAHCKKRPLIVHENVLVFYKKCPTFNRLESSSIIEVVGHAQRNLVHPTQKPLHLLDYLIKTYSNKGDTVLDPVMGSGTTGVAALRCGRNFIGIEKEKKYFDIALSRMESVPKRKLF